MLGFLSCVPGAGTTEAATVAGQSGPPPRPAQCDRMKEAPMPDPAYLFGPDRPRRPCVMAQRHVVVSGHYYASLAGLQILEAGGNAIDAGVATGLAIDVLASQFVGFGGVAPIMVYLGDRNATHVINGVGVWPKAANLEHFHRHFGGRIPDGLLHTVVPAAPANWITALERFGTMSFGDVGASAIRFAREGV